MSQISIRPALLLLAALSFSFPAQASQTSKTEHTLIDAWCADLGRRLHSVSAQHCRNQNFVAAEEKSSAGRLLVRRDIPPSTKGKSPRVLVIGGIHGDELTSVSIVFRWLDWIADSNAARYTWRVIPLANPDGLMIRPSTRTNGQGVDLNRNFPTPDWDKDAQNYWVQRTGRDPRRYPGKAAGSEIETRWLAKEIEDFKPDLIVSVHAPYNLLDYDGPAPQPLRFGRLALNRLGVYPGSLGNYGGLHKSVPVITIELPHASTMPPLRDQRAMWSDMLKWIQRNIKTP